MSYHPIVKELLDFLDDKDNANFRADFKDAFNTAYTHWGTILVEFEEYEVRTFEDFIRHMSDYVNWKPSENTDATSVLHHICFFYFIINFPPVGFYQSNIDPSTGSLDVNSGQKRYFSWLSGWLVRYAKEMGKWMDTPASLTQGNLKTFRDAPAYHMEDYIEPEDGWKTFNEFFARNINPEKRPIAFPDDPTVIVNPADCAFGGSWAVDEGAATIFEAKGVPWKITQLLDEDNITAINLGERFAGGTFTHSFLSPTDYHRQHAPVAGRIVDAYVIPGLCYLEVGIKPANGIKLAEGIKPAPGTMRLGWHRAMTPIEEDKSIFSLIEAEKYFSPISGPARIPIPNMASTDIPVGRAMANSRRADQNADFDAPNSPGYQFIQARALILIESDIGLVAVLPIGMAQVSSVVLSVKKGDYVKKGQEISFFQLGGSDIVMVFQKDAKVKFNQEKDKHYNFGVHVANATRIPKK